MDSTTTNNSTFTSRELDLVDTHAWTVPMDYPHLLSPVTPAQFWLRLVESGFLSPLAVVTNAVSAVSMIRGRLLKRWMYGMILNLCLAGIFLGLYNIVLILPGVITERWLFSLSTCRLRAIVPTICLTATLLTFTLSALHRYVIIVYNKGDAQFFNPRWLPVLIPAIWVVCLVLSLPVGVAGAPKLRLYPDNCVIINSSFGIFVLLLSGLTVVIPILMIPALYLHIYIFIRKAEKKVGPKSGSEKKKAGLSKHNKTALILFILYVVFIMTYLPILLLFITDPALDIHQRRFSLAGVWMCVYAGYAFNPFLYGILFKAVKESYFSLLCKKCHKIAIAREAHVTDLTISKS